MLVHKNTDQAVRFLDEAISQAVKHMPKKKGGRLFRKPPPQGQAHGEAAGRPLGEVEEGAEQRGQRPLGDVEAECTSSSCDESDSLLACDKRYADQEMRISDEGTSEELTVF